MAWLLTIPSVRDESRAPHVEFPIRSSAGYPCRVWFRREARVGASHSVVRGNPEAPATRFGGQPAMVAARIRGRVLLRPAPQPRLRSSPRQPFLVHLGLRIPGALPGLLATLASPSFLSPLRLSVVGSRAERGGARSSSTSDSGSGSVLQHGRRASLRVRTCPCPCPCPGRTCCLSRQ